MILECFRHQNSLKQRSDEAKSILRKHPDRIPIIVEPADDKSPTPDRKKFLVPAELTFGQFAHVVRKRLDTTPDQAVILMIGDVMPMCSSTVREVYEKHKDSDSFLYVSLCAEKTFGMDLSSNRGSILCDIM
jgi:GABA(A) receptor-associated protein